MKVPLFNQPVGMGINPQAPSLGAAASRMPGPDFGPAQARAEFEGGVRAEQRQLDERLINAGFQLAHSAIKAREEVVFHRQKRAFMYGADPEERNEDLRARVASIVNASRTGELTPDGNTVYDSQKAASQIHSVAELQEFLAQTSYQNWGDIIDEAVPMIEDHVLSNSGSLARGRFREWVKDSAGEMRMNYTLKAAQIQMQITRQMFDDEIQLLSSSGDADGAMKTLYAGLNQGNFSAHEVVMISNRINNDAPIHKNRNEGIARLRTAGPDGAREALDDHIAHMESTIVQGNPVVWQDGEWIQRGMTEAQFQQVRESLEEEYSYMVGQQYRQGSLETRQKDSGLRELLQEGSLTRQHLDNADFYSVKSEGSIHPDAIKTYDFWDSILSEWENATIDMHSRASSAQNELYRSELFDKDILSRIMNHEINTEEELIAAMSHLFSTQVEEDGQTRNLYSNVDDWKPYYDNAKNRLKEFGIIYGAESTLRDTLGDLLLSKSGTDRVNQRQRNNAALEMWNAKVNWMETQVNLGPEERRAMYQEAANNLIEKVAMEEGVSAWEKQLRGMRRDPSSIVPDDITSTRQFRNSLVAMEANEMAGVRFGREERVVLEQYRQNFETAITAETAAQDQFTDIREEGAGNVYASVEMLRTGINHHLIPNQYKAIDGQDGRPTDSYDALDYRIEMKYITSNGRPRLAVRNRNLLTWEFADLIEGTNGEPLTEALGYTAGRTTGERAEDVAGFFAATAGTTSEHRQSMIQDLEETIRTGVHPVLGKIEDITLAEDSLEQLRAEDAGFVPTEKRGAGLLSGIVNATRWIFQGAQTTEPMRDRQ